MGRDTREPVKKGTYNTPTPEGWVGWVEDKASSWILFYKTDGSALFYPTRAATGAVLGEGIVANVRGAE